MLNRNHVGKPRQLYNLWTLNKALCPEAPTTGGMDVAKTIFLVVFRHFATITEHTWRKIENPQSLTQAGVLWQPPDIIQSLIVKVTQDASLAGSKRLAQVADV